jgi:hypothetical protein
MPLGGGEVDQPPVGEQEQPPAVVEPKLLHERARGPALDRELA